MRNARAVAVLAVAAGAVWMAGLGAYPLLESTEGRYASIAAAMVRTGDFLDPRFDGLLHFHKPPLAYWAGAVSLAFLPPGELAVRLPATLAGVAALLLVVRLGVVCGLDRRRAAWAAAFAALSPLATVQMRMLSSDVFLWVGVLLAYAGLLDSRLPRLRRAALAGLGLGLGFLAKGPLVLLWTLLPILAWTPLGRTARWRPSPVRLLAHPVTWLVFAVVGLPWYVGEALRHPGLAAYWLGNQTAERFLTTVHGRAEPWWYFVVLLPGVVLPWLPETARGVARAVGRTSGDDPGNAPDPAVRRLWVIWAMLPVVFFSLSGSKRPNYLLPLVAPLALLAAAALPERRSRRAKVWTAVWGSVTLLLPFVAGALPGVAPPTREVARVARDLIASSRSLPVVTYRTLPSSFPFYVGRDVPTVGHGRGAPFDSPDTVALWSPRDPDWLGDLLERHGGIVLVRDRDLEEARRHAGRSLEVAAEAGELRLLVARPGGTGDSPP